MTEEGLIFIITYLAFFVGYWIGRKHENEKSWVSAHKDVENQLEEKDKRIAELKKRLEKAELIINHLLPHAEFSCCGTVNDWKIKEAKKFLKEVGKVK